MAAQYLERMGERIRTRREELKLSRSDVARSLPGKTNENAIYRWEKGQHRPADDTLEALAQVLDTTVSYFLAEEAEKGPTPDPFSGTQLDRIEAKLDAILHHLNAQAEEAALAAFDEAVDQQGGTPARSTARGKRAAGGRRGS